VTTKNAFGHAADLLYRQGVPSGADDDYLQRQLNQFTGFVQALGMDARVTATPREIRVRFARPEDKQRFIEKVAGLYRFPTNLRDAAPAPGDGPA